MPCTHHLSEELRSRGFRMTPQRMAILRLLHDSPRHFSPVEIYAHVRQVVPGVTEATVYRTLEFLAENDIVMPSLQPDGHLVYEDASHAHHHMICRACGQELEVEHEMVQGLYNQLEAKTGFKINTSHLTFFGLCSNCQKSQS